ncbi:3-oxoacyl-[acyl-carrier protein] reductase [Faunimonas pinastri]|uniref:3-oxoacyl-[acyl-carrier protein] reductase n=1 Tax=Faunimonas pinastri TaxID=1855383 RepID=A0A1H9E3Y6_9HYPH|nr:SDR family oxidoreductase [Faunimonas pinastri]SEQ20449.1 3-oxoacyl-[acyl-carrier protein] reductase [Faunimonas pinastri]
MDLKLQGRSAIVCGSSRGLGKACAEALAREGVTVLITGRNEADVVRTVAEINGFAPGSATGLACDVTSPEGRHALVEANPDPDILVNNSAGPSPRQFLDTQDEDWPVALEKNMIAPLLLTKAVLPGMIGRRFGRIINITSAMVTTPRPHMSLSSAPRAGLTAAMKAISLDVARYNVTINNMLPERIDTDRQIFMAKAQAQRENITFEAAREKQVQSIAARRLGRPEEFGATCAFLCSDLAGFMSGQNLHLDGGSYPSLV